MILQFENWSISELIKKAKIKFDWHIDALQLAGQFLQAKEVKDYPMMIEKIKSEVWQKFFENEAKNLKEDIIK